MARTIKIDIQEGNIGPLIVCLLVGFGWGWMVPHNTCHKPHKPLTPIEIQQTPAESDSPPLERGR